MTFPPPRRFSFLPANYWNWKCAAMSALARSTVYALAMARGGVHGRLAVVLVEVLYVTLTAGFYAGLQQRALGFRSRLLGNLMIVLGVPGLSQALDWLAHRAVHHTGGARATVAVGIFALISALFHLFVMRRGVFLTGKSAASLAEDLKRIPRLVFAFLVAPATVLLGLAQRLQTASLLARESPVGSLAKL